MIKTTPLSLAAFTLIELLLATSLAVLLLLMAVMTFSATTKTMKELQILSDENRQIRSGYNLATRDADFWHSHADPAFPYMQRHNAISKDEDSLRDKRPFRPIRWSKDLQDPTNPNWSQPHDPKSWYRNYLLPNVMTGIYTEVDQQGGKKKTTFAPDWATEGRVKNFKQRFGNKFVDQYLKKSISRPMGWDTRNQVGDYSVMSNINMDGEGEDDQIKGARPRQIWHIFNQLGLYGLYTYLHPGSLNLIQASSENEKRENYTDLDLRLDTHFNKGEIPWSLHANKKTLADDTMKILDGPRQDDDYGSYPAQFKDLYPNPNRGNYSLRMPSLNDIGRSQKSLFKKYPLLMDLEITNSDSLAFGVFQQGTNSVATSNGLTRLALFYPQLPRPKSIGGTAMAWYPYFRDVSKPIVPYGLRRTIKSGPHLPKENILTHNYGDRYLTPYSLTTWHQPKAMTGENPSITEIGTGLQSGLSTTIRRHRYNGNDIAQCHIRLHREEGETQLLRFRTLSTSFRGARNHWGRRSGSRGVADGLGGRVPMGDIYE